WAAVIRRAQRLYVPWWPCPARNRNTRLGPGGSPPSSRRRSAKPESRSPRRGRRCGGGAPVRGGGGAAGGGRAAAAGEGAGAEVRRVGVVPAQPGEEAVGGVVGAPQVTQLVVVAVFIDPGHEGKHAEGGGSG